MGAEKEVIPRKVLVFGANGMLGFTVMHMLRAGGFDVTGTVRGALAAQCGALKGHVMIADHDVEDFDAVHNVLDRVQPDVIINCTAVKSVSDSAVPMNMLAVNALFPKRLETVLARYDCHLIHISTDSIFDGSAHPHDEGTLPAPLDLYSMSKLLGEVTGPKSLTIRTSMIGRSIDGKPGFVDWALANTDVSIKGFSRAIFSGLPVNIIGEFLQDRILPLAVMPSGLLHLAAKPIDKLALLRLVRDAWERPATELIADETMAIDRRLESRRIQEFNPHGFADWPALIKVMRAFYQPLGY